MGQALNIRSDYKRVLLKLSGEALQGDHLFGVDPSKLSRIAQEILSVTKLGVQLAIVIGGGNLIRGSDLCAGGFDRVIADQMGMLATVINGLALRDAMQLKSMPVALMSAFGIAGIAEQYHSVKAIEALNSGQILIFVGGTGNPLVTTDTAAALRGIEVNANILLKATKVDGVYDEDPIKHPEANRYSNLTYEEVILKRLRVMDLSSILLCQEHRLPLRVFNMNKTGALSRIVMGEDIGTLIKDNE